MATLSDVQYALNGEAQKSVDKLKKDISGIVTYDPKNPPKEEKEWVIFKLVENTKKGGVYIPSIDDVLNPATGKIERIRLLAGVDSIWMKDQKEVTPEYAKKNLRNIEFPRGVKMRRVKSVDKTMIEFMRICNSNVGNLSKVKSSRFGFYEYDAAAAEKEAFERESFELEVAILAKQEKLEPMKKHAAFLGIRLVNEIGEPKTEEGIRREYVVYAKRNPEYFKRTMASKEVEVSWLVRKAIADVLIDIGREPGKAYWAKDGGMIGAIPQTENPQNYLTQLAMTNTPEGEAFKKQLETLVK